MYIGKAKNLKNRLISYSQANLPDTKTQVLVSKILSANWQITDSELEALLLEAHLIRTLKPPYNIHLKDDKSPLYIIITKETFPRVLSVRGNDLANHSPDFIFGPFLSSSTVRLILRMARSVFPYCNASPKQKAELKPCFYVHLHLCPGACQGKISSAEYSQNIKALSLFLKGDFRLLKNEIKSSLEKFVKKEDFESANQEKNKLQQLDLITQSFTLSWDPLADLFPAAPNPSLKLVSLSRILNLHGKFTYKINLSRMEAFDCANISGKYAAASMVVFLNGHATPSAYRSFHLHTINTPHDPLMIFEAVQRRLKHREWAYPGLIMIDGGKSQLSKLVRFVPQSIILIGLAKNPDHLIIRTSSQNLTAASLEPHDPATLLLQSMRDEAHRFAGKLFHHSLLKQFQ